MVTLKKASTLALTAGAALIARLGMPAVLAVVALATLAIVVVTVYAFWVTSSDTRSLRVALILKLAHGHAEVMALSPTVGDKPASVRWWRRKRDIAKNVE